jgi:TolA-binding protein
MAKLLEVFSAQKQLRQQQREIDQLREELSNLRTQNESMREGMWRCVTCDYRIEFRERQDGALEAELPPAPLQTETDRIPD